MGCFPCLDSKPKEGKSLKKEDNNSSRNGQSPADNPVAQIPKLSSGTCVCIWNVSGKSLVVKSVR